MYYVSTRNKQQRTTAAQAIARGLSPDGGLMTPEVFPKLSGNALDNLRDMSYQQRAVYVMKSYLDEFTASELTSFANKAYGPDRFDVKEVAPVRTVSDGTYCLELWHGPTCAFKDMALQMLPHLLSASLAKTAEQKTVCILVATSGDTGKAALEGFRDVDRTKILVFYPKDGVSAIQELQMLTQEGDNVGVCSVVGNFDDAQVREYMKQLADTGRYEVSDKVKDKLQKTFAAGFCDDAQTQKTIGALWNGSRYLADPHTAVAFHVLEQYRQETGDTTPTLVVSTASPFKFCDNVLGALGESQLAPGTGVIDQLSEKTGVAAPASLAALRDKQVRFGESIAREAMLDKVLDFLR